ASAPFRWRSGVGRHRFKGRYTGLFVHHAPVTSRIYLRTIPDTERSEGSDDAHTRFFKLFAAVAAR
ncbi:MAG: hypothetical protein J0J15_11350, partial [Mesorhizobium sp.]|nr:hypothetical protein [Mesorhizobium sp.]